MKIAIVTDSTAYLTDGQYKENMIYKLPLSVVIDDQVFQEEVEIKAAEFFEKIRTSQTFPTSSQPSAGQITTLFNELAKNYDAIISIHLSSEISGTYHQVAAIGKTMENIAVYPYDSGLSCAAQAYYVLEAARMAEKGATVKEIFQAFDEIQERIKAYFIVDDLHNLVRGGRLTNGSAVIGSLLKIKPILYFNEKKIVVFEKIRTSKKALKRIEELLDEDTAKGYPIVATIIHANAEKKALEWKEKLKETYPDVRFEISYFGPVIGTHLGKGALGMAWTEDRERKLK